MNLPRSMSTSPLAAMLVLGCSLHAQVSWSLDDGDGTGNDCDNYYEYGHPFFGDTHVHTGLSIDAFTQGVDTTLIQAYQFAKGAEIGLHPFDVNGDPTRFVQLERPLDFAMISDHAEFFGEYVICQDMSNPALYEDPACQLLRQRDNEAFLQWNSLLGRAQDDVFRWDVCGPDGSICSDMSANTWTIVKHVADTYYDRSADCSFTTFIGYEWTGAPTGRNEDNKVVVQNLHRNVMFRNSITPDRPTTYLDAPYPEQLWSSLRNNCLNIENEENPDHTCEVLTIPHNSNLSEGLMFETLTPAGTPYNSIHSLNRRTFEPLVEIMQHKGQSECVPLSNDELCNFEVIPWGHLAGNFIGPTEPRVDSTVRYALTEGLAMQQAGNGNPFKYGIIGSTDTHLGTPGLMDEAANYPGHGGASQGSLGGAIGEGITDTPEFNPGGLAVVWAKQNSRGSLYDAMARRETYATSGPRHVVRFFSGWDYPGDMCDLDNEARVQLAYATGVPMGSDMGVTEKEQLVPKFLVSALMDGGTENLPGTELQRIQIIKGWVDAAGVKHETVHEVAGEMDNGASVDVSSCTVMGNGYSDLCTVWEDPGFDAAENAYYYARVLENPSCRWTQKQCVAAGIDCSSTVPDEYAACCDADIPKTIQERSWTSPIWYTPPPDEPPSGC